MSDNGDFSEEEHSDAEDYNEDFARHDNGGENADDGARPASSMAREITQLRTNDPFLFPRAIFKYHFSICPSVTDPIRVKLAEALTQNTIVQRIRLNPHDYSNLSTHAMAKYLAQSKRLLYVELGEPSGMSFGFRREQALCTFIKAIGQNTSVTHLSLMNLGLGTASESFENLLTGTKTLRHLRVGLERQGPLEEATAAIASGFSKNTTLREIHLLDWQETSLISVLTALRDHPVLEKLQVESFSCCTGIDALLRGKNSQLKELIIEKFNGSTVEQVVVGFESFMLEMGRNTTILKMIIADVPLGPDNIQQLKAMLRRNTVLQYLDISGDALGSAGLAEVVSALYRNTSIQGLDISANGLDDLAAASTLRELLRRNKTITRLYMDNNAFGMLPS
jgi:hypothetical protein